MTTTRDTSQNDVPINKITSELKQPNRTAFEKHVSFFTDAQNNFSKDTIGKGLEKLHSTDAYSKAGVISFFNGFHSGTYKVCPAGKKAFSQFLHQGTTRIWNFDGSINEARWKQFADFVTKGQADGKPKIVTYSKLKEYLDHCYNTDKPEPETGRRDFIFDKAWDQRLAAVKAWDEIYSLGKEGDINADPYISLANIRLFFVDTEQFCKNLMDGAKKQQCVPRGVVAS